MIRTALSFSGGKDSTYALYKLKQLGCRVECLVTTRWKGNRKTVAHGENEERINSQAEQLGIPLVFIDTDFEDYTDDFKQKLLELKKKYKLDAIAFGDIYLEGHREWGEQLANATELDALYPLWTKQEHAVKLLHEYVADRFKSKVIRVDEEKLPKEWIGREVDESFIEDILKYDVCPLGENGEYHTYVYDGPIFEES